MGADQRVTVLKSLYLFIIILTACLLCIDTTSGLSLRWLTAPLLTAFLISWPTAFIPNRLREVVQLVLGEAVIFICLVDCYCQEIFASAITPQILSNIILSDTRESLEFLSTFIGYHVLSHWRVFVLVIFILLFPIGLFLQNKYISCLHPNKKVIYAGILLFVTSLACEALPLYRYAQLFFQNSNLQKMEGFIFRHYHEDVPTPLHRFLFSHYSLQQSSHVLEKIKKSTFEAQIDSCFYQSSHIVIVIGESYNKHHSSIYGYPLNTTPLLQKRKDNGELHVFKDVVSPWNITSNDFLSIFSLWEYGLTATIAEKPLFPILFRRAGYEVNFFSNQYVLRGFRKGATNQAGHFFLADGEISNNLFSFRNKRTSKYDMGLVRQVEKYKTMNGQSEHSLDIIHLIGQHFEYEERYPEQDVFFSTRSYADRDLDEKARTVVMHYDNATYYDDIVLDHILSLYKEDDAIVLFVADHGEEVYDDEPIHGRLFQEPTLSQARNEYEVPMWIWCSESYRQSHPDVIRDIVQAQNRPFMTDGLPQVLLSLAGISCQWTDESKNLLSPNYRCKPRIIGGCVDYDKLKK